MNAKKGSRRTIFLLLFVMLSLTGCADDTQKPPEIANLVYEFSRFPVHEGGTANVTGTINVERVNGETASVNSVVYDAQGKQVSQTSIPLSDAALRTANALAFLAEVSTDKKENYTFHVYTIDSQGRQSNKLIGTVTITDIF